MLQTANTENGPHLPQISTPIPEPPGQRLLGNLKEVKADFFNTFVRWHEQYGDLLRFRMGPKTFFLLSHPALAEEVLVRRKADFQKIYNPQKPRGLALVLGQGLVTSDGPLWQRQRRLMQPVFHKSNIALMVPAMHKACEELIEKWEKQPHGQPLDIPTEMTRVTLEIITRTMFSCSVHNDVPWLGPALKYLLDFAQNNFFNPFSLPLWVPTAANVRMKSHMKRLTALVAGLVDQRRHAAQQKDLLDLLIQARDPQSGDAMDLGQIVDECLTIFNAGHETTANALSWTLYLLSQHPPVLRRLRAEVNDVLGARQADFSDLAALEYCEAVIEESMRRYPPVVALLRRSVCDTEVHGHRIPRGAIVFINIRNIHHHPHLWHEPMMFDPSRFLQPQRASIMKLGYMPFGAGHRVCIGNHLAMVEAKILLSTIVRRFEFGIVPGHRVREHLAITLQPKYGLPMLLRSL